METIRQELCAMAEAEYKQFQSRLMPTVEPSRILGVRTPKLRALARRLTLQQRETVLSSLPHRFYEENNLHAFIIEQTDDYDECVRLLDEFLPYVDNWATCDSMRPRALSKRPQALLAQCREWMNSAHPYTVRFGMEMLMLHGLDNAACDHVLKWVAGVSGEDYYVRMMQAWFFATALTKCYDRALPYLHERRLSPWVHNKAIQKATESRLVGADTKAYLRTLKITTAPR